MENNLVESTSLFNESYTTVVRISRCPKTDSKHGVENQKKKIIMFIRTQSPVLLVVSFAIEKKDTKDSKKHSSL